MRELATRPLIAHVLFRLDYGGLENGVVNLINGLPTDMYRHCVIALTEATDFKERIETPGVEIHELQKRPGKDPGAYVRLFRALRHLKPALLHTRNVGTLDCVPLAKLAGVRACVHGEHGWDVHDPEGSSLKYRRWRRLVNPMVRHFVAVSRELERWLVESVNIPASKVIRICNGVDTERFRPDASQAERTAAFGPQSVVFGSVLRFNEIKDPLNLIRAFIAARPAAEQRGVDIRLVMVGDGPLRPTAQSELKAAGLADAAWLPGSRDDVAELLRSFDVFVLGSRREGISNTLLEAMASGLPAIATDTGGNKELIRPGLTGTLVGSNDPEALAREMLAYALDAPRRETQGRAARALAADEYSMLTMLNKYQQMYATTLATRLG